MLVRDMIGEVRRHLQGGMKDNFNLLGVPLAETEENVVLADELQNIARGTILERDLEQMYVRAVNEATRQVTVVRGFNGTSAQQHALGDFVLVDPSFYAADILQAIIDEISQLQGVGIMRFETVSSSTRHLRADVLPLQLATGSRPLFVQQAMQETRTGYWRPVKVDLIEDLGPEFDTDHGLRVIGDCSRMRTLRVTLATTIGTPSGPDDDVYDLGLTEVSRQIVPIGAAWKMVLRKEGQRVNPDHSHGSRRGEETPPNSVSMLGRVLRSVRDDLIQQALEEQVRRYAPRVQL